MSEELNFEEQPIFVPQEELQEVAEETPVVAPAPVEVKKVKEVKKSNEVKVVRIVQHLPSGYRLLLEGGEIIKVKKSQYTQGQKTVKL